MKIKVGDQVIVSSGKDKGLKAKVIKTYPRMEKVIVEGANMYTRNYKPMGGQPGRQVKRERPLHVGSVAVINDKGQPDRVGYTVAKDGSKVRVFKKTNSPMPEIKTTKSST